MSKSPEEKHDLQVELQKFEMQTDLAFKYGVNIAARSIQLVGEIDENMFILVDTALSILERLSKAAITIKISSGGGAVYDALAIVGRMKSSKCKIITEAHGHAMSAASLILAAGNKRRMSEFCWVMFHEAWGGVEGPISNMEHQIKQTKREWAAWSEAMAKFTTAPKAYWLSQGRSGNDLYLTAEECMNLGIIDEVF